MSYEYSRFDKETKSYINMAVDINSALMNRIVTVYDDHHKLVLTSNDKVILALFMAAFFFGGNLSRMLKKYNDIDGGQLLDFCGLNKICKLASDEEHREIYEKRFKYPIMRMICNDNKWICNSLTPESIFTYLVRKDQNSLRVINAFARTYLHLEFFKNFLFAF